MYKVEIAKVDEIKEAMTPIIKREPDCAAKKNTEPVFNDLFEDIES